MAFGKISRDLAIPGDATATYTFHQLRLCPEGPPTLTLRHAGDGTPAYKRATWHATAALASRPQRRAGAITESTTEAKLIDEAKRVADHCVVSWENVFDDGESQPSPCTPAKVLEFLTALIEADDGIPMYMVFSAWAHDADNFRPPVGDPAELGKG